MSQRLFDDFSGPELDPMVWFPYYLPHWSSRTATRAVYEFVDEGLRVFIPPDQALWCHDLHSTPLRVSGFASGSFSGPVGSTDGPQAFEPGLQVREEQPRFEGWLAGAGHLEIECRMTLSARSMAAMWLSGFEDEPGRAGEICVVEIFGKDATAEAADIGVGHKQLGDPDLAQDFDAPRVELDITDLHTYAVDWDERESVFSVDGTEIRRCPSPPLYPKQIMIGVFDFPNWSNGSDSDLVPELVITRVAGNAIPAELPGT
jgi:hypothetical protein